MRNLRIDLPLAERIFGLDLMRAVAIALVLLLNGDPLVRRNFPEFPRFWFMDGVDLFFVLSGFLIGGILIRTFEKNGFHFRPTLHFWKFRWFRTLPNYYLVLLITMGFVLLKDGSVHDYDWRYLFFLQNLTGPIPHFFTVSWSLVVEEWFYLSFPLVMMLFSGLFPLLKTRNIVLLTTLFFILFPLCLRIWMVFSQLDPGELKSISSFFNFEMEFRAVAMFRLDSISFGVLGAYISHYHGDVWRKYRVHAFLVGLITYLFLRAFVDSGLAKFTINFTLCSLALAMLLPLASTVRSAPRSIAVPVTHLSIVSYSAYLIHRCLLVDGFRAFGGRPFTDLQAALYYISYFILVYVFSTWIYKYFEAPVMRLRERNYIFKRRNAGAVRRLVVREPSTY